MAHHGAGLRRLSGSDELAQDLAKLNLESPRLELADRALLAYAVKLTRAPSSVCRKDVESLRRQGFEDRAIHDLCQVVAYFNYVNRIADGLGVDLEERFTASEENPCPDSLP